MLEVAAASGPGTLKQCRLRVGEEPAVVPQDSAGKKSEETSTRTTSPAAAGFGLRQAVFGHVGRLRCCARYCPATFSSWAVLGLPTAIEGSTLLSGRLNIDRLGNETTGNEDSPALPRQKTFGEGRILSQDTGSVVGESPNAASWMSALKECAAQISADLVI